MDVLRSPLLASFEQALAKHAQFTYAKDQTKYDKENPADQTGQGQVEGAAGYLAEVPAQLDRQVPRRGKRQLRSQADSNCIEQQYAPLERQALGRQKPDQQCKIGQEGLMW